jgi:hypothetical protein
MMRISGSSNNSSSIFLIIFFFIMFSMSKNLRQANAQMIPLPTPSPASKTIDSKLDLIQDRNHGTGSPIIEFLTTSLLEGTSVLKVKITDKTDLSYAEMSYVKNGNVVTQGLLRDPNNVYKALIVAHQPSAVIVINAVDSHGQKASAIKQLIVTSLPYSILVDISNLFFNVGKFIVSELYPQKSV